MKVNKLLIIPIASIISLTACRRTSYKEVDYEEFQEAVQEALLEDPDYSTATLTYSMAVSSVRQSYRASFRKMIPPGDNEKQWTFESGDQQAATFSYYVGLTADQNFFPSADNATFYTSSSGFQVKFKLDELGLDYKYTVRFDKYAYLTSYEASNSDMSVKSTIKVTYKK